MSEHKRVKIGRSVILNVEDHGTYTPPGAAHAEAIAKIGKPLAIPSPPAKPATGPVLESASPTRAKHERHKRHRS